MADGAHEPPEHESALRRLMSLAAGAEYFAFESLEAAREDTDAVVILEGDEGGQVFAVFPVSTVNCDAGALDQLLRDLDEIAWPVNSPDMAHVFFERHGLGAHIAGGMGGAMVVAGGWVHAAFEGLSLDGQIRDVIAGRRARIEYEGALRSALETIHAVPHGDGRPAAERNVIEATFDVFGELSGCTERWGSWYRRSAETIVVLALREGRHATSYDVNVGVWLLALGDADAPREDVCHVRARLTQLVPRGTEARVAELLDLDLHLGDADRRNELLGVLNTYLSPLIDDSSTLDGLRTGRGRAIVQRCSLITGPAQRLLVN